MGWFRRPRKRTGRAGATGLEGLILESVATAWCGQDPTGRLCCCNRAFEQMFGLDRSRILGRTFFDLMPETAPDLWWAREQVLERGEPVRCEIRWNPEQGSARRLVFDHVLLRDERGMVHGVVSSVMDVTAEKDHELDLVKQAEDLAEVRSELESHAIELTLTTERLAQAEAAAAAASASKSTFLAHMSHEIRTPLTAILGFAELLQDGAVSPEDVRAHLTTIRRNGEHLLALINDILDISKIEAGKMTVERIACSPVQIVQEIVGLMGSRAEQKGLTLTAEFPDPAPSKVHTDPLRLRQIVVNLVGNAIKFTANGGVRIKVRCTPPGTAAGKLSIEVVDTGIGMTPQQLEHLFQPFEQADASTSRQYGGTGLGLAICKRLAEILGGGIRADSAPGSGSSFVVWVDPGEVEFAALARPELAAPALPKAGSEKLRGRVLLAEDGPDNQRLIRFLLERVGLQVTLAGDGQQAIEAYEAAKNEGRPFDLVLMDMQMPVMDGYEAATRLRAMDAAIPIVALTAHAMSGDKEKCLAAGCDEFATKPIDRAALFEVLTRRLMTVA